MVSISEGSISLTQMRLCLTTGGLNAKPEPGPPLQYDAIALARRGRVTSPVPVVKPPVTEQSDG